MNETLSGWRTTVRRGPHGRTATAAMLISTGLCAVYVFALLVLSVELGPEEGLDFVLAMVSSSLLFAAGLVWGVRRLVLGRTRLQVTVTDTQVRMRVLAPWGERDLPSVALAGVADVALTEQFFQQTLSFDQRKVPISVPFEARQELLRRIQGAHAAARALPVEAPPEALGAMVPSAARASSDTPIVLPASHEGLSARLRLWLLLLLAVAAGAVGVISVVASVSWAGFFDPRILLLVLGGPIVGWQLAQVLRAQGERVVLQPRGGALVIQKMRGDWLLSEQLIPFDRLGDIRLRPSAIRQTLFLNHDAHTVIVPPQERQPLVDLLKAWRERGRHLPVPEPAVREPVAEAAPKRRPRPQKVTS